MLVWDTPTSPPRWVVYRCNSWRHEGDCAARAVQRCYARTKEALENCAPSELSYCVLTFEQRGRRTFADPIEAYRGLGQALSRLVRRIRRLWPGEPVDYVATVERHRSGWPHLNVIFRSAALAEYVAAFCEDRRADSLLRALQQASGFGPVAWWEPVRDRGAIADYLSKVAGEFLAGAGRLSSEVVKLTQLPLNAPARLRRIRASARFLPLAKRARKCFTGVLVRGRGEIPNSGAEGLDGEIEPGSTELGADEAAIDGGEWRPETGSRTWYEGHLNRQGLTVSEDWTLVAREPDDDQIDDRAAFFGSVMEAARDTRDERDWRNGRRGDPDG